MARKSKNSEQHAQTDAPVSLNGASAEGHAAADSTGESGGGAGRLLLLLIIGAILALALSKDLRGKLLDLLFGAEEEFDYSSTTMPASDLHSVGAPAA
jgi:hypothetical protein